MTGTPPPFSTITGDTAKARFITGLGAVVCALALVCAWVWLTQGADAPVWMPRRGASEPSAPAWMATTALGVVGGLTLLSGLRKLRRLAVRKTHDQD